MDIKSLKPKLTVLEQVAHMKKCGITFSHTTEEEAEKYLLEHTYYFKLKAYAKNYMQRNMNSARKGTYINLDFSYLQDLARLDMYFREIVFKTTVDIEHLLKVKLLGNVQKNKNDDGYETVKEFLMQRLDIADSIKKHSASGYNAALIQKYRERFPVWVFVEIISFGDFIAFYKFYAGKYSVRDNISKYLWSARILRNAAAHNSCILNRLTEKFPESKINNSLMNNLKRDYKSLNVDKIKHYLQNPVIQDFLDILILFKRLDKSKSLFEKRVNEIYRFIKRCRKHATYYRNNNILISEYRFLCEFFRIYVKK